MDNNHVGAYICQISDMYKCVLMCTFFTLLSQAFKLGTFQLLAQRSNHQATCHTDGSGLADVLMAMYFYHWWWGAVLLRPHSSLPLFFLSFLELEALSSPIDRSSKLM